MNELTIVIGDYSCIYWKTNKTNCNNAMDELFEIMESNNINVDLMITRAKLRDKNDNIIDEIGRE